MAGRSLFLDLPGEIRNAIYEFYIDDYQPKAVALLGRSVRAPEIPLAYTCHIIRKEFLYLWTGSATDMS